MPFHLPLYVSSGLDIVSVIGRLAGRPGIPRLLRLRSQATVARTWAGVPTVVVNPVVSRVTVVVRQSSCRFARLCWAAVVASVRAAAWVRAMEAARAASLAADCTTWWAI